MMRKPLREWFECCKKKVNKMEEIKLKKCPCCGGESKFRNIDGVSGRPISVCACCTKCGLETKAFKVSADYCAKEEAAKVWNLRAQQINLKHQIDLKCPICGGKDIYCEGGIMTKSRIVCTECGTEILIGDKKQVEKIITEIKKLI